MAASAFSFAPFEAFRTPPMTDTTPAVPIVPEDGLREFIKRLMVWKLPEKDRASLKGGMALHCHQIDVFESELRSILAAAPVAPGGEGLDILICQAAFKAKSPADLPDKPRLAFETGKRIATDAILAALSPSREGVEPEAGAVAPSAEHTPGFPADEDWNSLEYAHPTPADDRLAVAVEALVKELRSAANGLFRLKTERGDYGYFDDLADRVALLTKSGEAEG
jgi:hypothetical protein